MKNKRGRGERRGPRGGSDLDRDMKLIQSDPRFAHVTSDPKFHHIPKKERKVKLDSRFHSILTDDKFYEKSTMDPRGRKGNYSTKEDLLRFYHLSSDEEEDEEEEEEEEEEDDDDEEGEEEEENKEDSSEEEKAVNNNSKSSNCKTENKLKKTKIQQKENDERKQGEKKKTEKGNSMSNKESSAVDSEEDSASRDEEERLQVAPEINERLQDLTKDYARGGGDLFSSDSSDDDSSTTDDEVEEGEEFEWAELDKDAVWDNEVEVEETSRIAVCNLDWDRIKAADLMVLFSSFCPRGGSVKSVAIYPSEYGKKRMAEEDRCGPQELTGASSQGKTGKEVDEEEEEEEEEEEKKSASADMVDLDKLEKGKLDESAGATRQHFEALRRYQRNRLRYFYAVMECDSVDTARTLYQECDRQPFEGAGILLDLRYIPLDMTFEETPHDICQTIPHSYKSKSFVTTALQNTRPALTWDETDPERSKALSSAMTQAMKGGQLEEDQLKDFIASSSEEEEEEEEEEEKEDDNSSDEEGNEEVKAARIAKFRALIREIDEKEKMKKEREIDMEDILEDTRGEEEEKKEEDGEEEEATNESQNGDAQLNPFEKYLEKRRAKKKEKRKKQKANKMQEENKESDALISDDDGMDDLYSDPFFAEEMKKTTKKKGKKTQQQDDEKDAEDEDNDKSNLELLLMDEDQEDKKHFNMREIIKNSEADTKKRRKNKLKKKMQEKQKEQKNKSLDEFKVNISDPRFSELMTSGEYNIDPSHPQFKRTQAMDQLIGEIQRKRVAESGEEMPGAKRPCLGEETKHSEFTSLVQRVKKKTGKIKGSSKRSIT